TPSEKSPAVIPARAIVSVCAAERLSPPFVSSFSIERAHLNGQAEIYLKRWHRMPAVRRRVVRRRAGTDYQREQAVPVAIGPAPRTHRPRPAAINGATPVRRAVRMRQTFMPNSF